MSKFYNTFYTFFWNDFSEYGSLKIANMKECTELCYHDEIIFKIPADDYLIICDPVTLDINFNLRHKDKDITMIQYGEEKMVDIDDMVNFIDEDLERLKAKDLEEWENMRG